MTTRFRKFLLTALAFFLLSWSPQALAQRILEDGWGTDDWGGNEPQTAETVTVQETNERFQQVGSEPTSVGDRTVVVVENAISEEPLESVSAVSISGITGVAGKVPEVKQIGPTQTTALGWTVTVSHIDDGTTYGRIVAVGKSPPRDTSVPPSDREVREVADLAPPPAPPPAPPAPPAPPGGGPPPGAGPPPVPPILTFTANPPAIPRGATSRLDWTSNASSCLGDCVSGDCTEWDNTPPGLGTFKPTNGNQTVSPDVTATYRLSCFLGSAAAIKEVTVSVGQIKWREIIPRLFQFIPKLFGASQ